MEMAQIAAFEEFVRYSRKNLLLSAIAMCGDWHDADDLVQEALMILYRRWLDVEPTARNAYVRTVMAHLLAREHRKVRWQRESLLELLPEPNTRSERQSAVEDVDALVDRVAIWDVVGTLPARQRSAVFLRYWRGLSTEEIAQALRTPAGTVRSDLARAAARLKGALQVSFPSHRADRHLANAMPPPHTDPGRRPAGSA